MQQQQRPSWFQRNPFMAGLMGAVAGSALFAMLGSAFGGLGGFGGGLMTILLLAGLAMLALRFFRSRQQPGLANAGQAMGQTPTPFAFRDVQPEGGRVADIGAYRQTREQGLAAIALDTPSFTTAKVEDELSQAFFQVQEAWSAVDRNALQALTSPDIYAEFADELDELARKGERNVIKNLVVRGFEITEAWQDETEEFITARIDARLIDYVERQGQVVDGSATEPTEFREAWTFSRPRRGGGKWLLSAINQF
jgi:predicted lipid-binding transport protein (Tim44 family)